MSLFGVSLSILTYALLWGRLQENATSNVPTKVLLHLCMAIGMTDILAILAGPVKDHKVREAQQKPIFNDGLYRLKRVVLQLVAIIPYNIEHPLILSCNKVHNTIMR